jgi:hypothetical protein
MHRLMRAAGVVSLSEPQWLNQLTLPHLRGGFSEQETDTLLAACAKLDCRLARQRQRSPLGGRVQYAINPKSFVNLLPAAARAFPEAKHIMMYRDYEEVRWTGNLNREPSAIRLTDPFEEAWWPRGFQAVHCVARNAPKCCTLNAMGRTR